KIEAGKLLTESTRFSLPGLIRRCASLFEISAANKKLKLNVSIPTDGPEYFIGDSLRINQVLSNLVSNAVKFTSRGSICIDATVKVLTERDAVITLTVRDSGIGMSAEQVQKLFDPFTQADTSTSRRFGGTGLGLAISKRLVSLLDGHIRIES